MGTVSLVAKQDVAPEAHAAVEIADADMDRIMVAYAATYFPNGVLVSEATPGTPEVPAIPDVPEVPAVTDPETGEIITPAVPAVPGVPGVPAVPPTEAVYRAPNGSEVLLAMAQGIIAGVIANTISFERNVAAQQAQANVPGIPVTPVE